MPGKKWAHREKESLIRQAKQGKRLPQIRISGRSPAAVNQQRQRLRNVGLLGEVPKRRLRMWTTKEIRSPPGYVNRSRLSATQIARAGLLASPSKDSISQQMRRQGLGDPKRPLPRFPPRVLPDSSSLGDLPTALRGLACPI